MLAGALGDTPESVISVHLLARGLADAYVTGDPAHPDGVIVQSASDPGELMSFGLDAAVLWELLRLVKGWWCVSGAEACARNLGAGLEARTGSEVRYYADIYHVLRGPVPRLHHEAAHPLRPEDLELVEAAPAEVRGSGWGSAREMLEEGGVAGVVVAGRLVSIAFTSARSPEHADVAVNTWKCGEVEASPLRRPPSWRGACGRPDGDPCGARERTTGPPCGSCKSWASPR